MENGIEEWQMTRAKQGQGGSGWKRGFPPYGNNFSGKNDALRGENTYFREVIPFASRVSTSTSPFGISHFPSGNTEMGGGHGMGDPCAFPFVGKINHINPLRLKIPQPAAGLFDMNTFKKKLPFQILDQKN